MRRRYPAFAGAAALFKNVSRSRRVSPRTHPFGLLGLFLKLPFPVSAFRIPLNRRAAAAAGAEPLFGPFQSGAMPHASRRCVSMGSMLAPAGTTVAPSARTSATVRGAAAT
jgi:hypothetical protein